MGLTALLDLELAVPRPDELQQFWVDHGMQLTTAGTLGTTDRPSQLRLREGGYRHVSELRVECETEADLVAIASRLDALGIASAIGDGVLRCADPVLDHDVVVQVRGAAPITPAATRQWNLPGVYDRIGQRSPACISEQPHSPRRLGHVVFGSSNVEASRAFFVDGLGFKVSDSFGEFAYFLRCSNDHHNLLITPAAVPNLNHYALEMDGIDAIGLAGQKIVAERPDCSVTGVGRHVVGANMFWYLLDPAGGMFELYSDMDQIADDEKWAAENHRTDWNPFEEAAWNSTAIKPDFFEPVDIADIAKGREAAGH